MLNLPARALIPICFFNHGLNSSKTCSFFIFSGLAWQAGETITACFGDSGMITQIIKGYCSYARFKFLVNLEPLNREPVNRYLFYFLMKGMGTAKWTILLELQFIWCSFLVFGCSVISLLTHSASQCNNIPHMYNLIPLSHLLLQRQLFYRLPE